MNAMNRFAADQGYNTGTAGSPISGMAYDQSAYQRPKPRMSNPLDEKQFRLLMNTFQEEFNLKVTEEEMAKAICTHKYPEGMPGVDPKMYGKYATVPVPGEPGMMMCKICHTKFNPDIVDVNYVEDMVEKYHNVIETCKLIGLDLNSDVIKQYFSMTPYVERLPKLYNAVIGVFERYNNINTSVITDGVAPNPYAMYNSLVSPTVPIGPGYGYGMGMPGYTQYPQYGAMMGMQQSMVQGGANPFYAAGQPQMAPMNPPQMPGQPNDPQQPTGGTVEINEQVRL